MKPTRRDLLRSCLVVGAGALASACSSLVSRPPVVKATFLLDPPLPAAAAAPAKNAVLRIGTINVAAPFRGKNFVFRSSELSYEADFYDEFFVPPAVMLADAIAKGLATANVFQRVVPAGAAGNEGDYLLDGFVSELYADARGTKTAAVLSITFYLTSMANVGGAPVWTHAYSQREELGASATAQAVADGLNRALGAILGNLARDLAGATLPAG